MAVAAASWIEKIVLVAQLTAAVFNKRLGCMEEGQSLMMQAAAHNDEGKIVRMTAAL